MRKFVMFALTVALTAALTSDAAAGCRKKKRGGCAAPAPTCAPACAAAPMYAPAAVYAPAPVMYAAPAPACGSCGR